MSVIKRYVLITRSPTLDQRQEISMKATRTAIYARVSTIDQSVDSQLETLKEVAQYKNWDVRQTIIEKVSGAKNRSDRKGLDDLLKSVTKREIDMVMIFDISRLGRSLGDLVSTMEEINIAGANLYIHTQGLDTQTTAGKAMFQMCGVFAEFERSMIRERVKAGISVARRKGKAWGRPTVKKSIVRKVTELLEKDLSIRAIAEKAGTSTFIVQKVKKDAVGGDLIKISGSTKIIPSKVIADKFKGKVSEVHIKELARKLRGTKLVIERSKPTKLSVRKAG